jgi:L-ascorbate metabolism protein UlaG (beta-lactamase superfamily)
VGGGLQRIDQQHLGFRERVLELEREHRRRHSLARAFEHGWVTSWLWRWLKALLKSTRPSVLAGPPPPIPLPSAGECSLSFIGHATVLVRYANGRVLTDPCFARSLYSLRRARACALPPGALEGLDVILISHDHADHLHPASLDELGRAAHRDATLVVPPRLRRAHRLDFKNVVELEPGASVRVAGLEVTAVPARHRTGWFGARALGYVVRGDGPTVYFAGDTGYFSGFLDVGARFRPDVALLPISGYRPRALRRDHLSPLDALYAFEDLGARLLVPIHHSAFALGYEPLTEPITWLRSLTSARGLSDRVAWLEPGESCVARRAPELLP